MSTYNSNAEIYEQQIVILDTTPASVTSGALVVNGGLSTKDTQITGRVVINNVDITPNLNDIILEQEFTLENNVSQPTNITNFYFSNSLVTSFKAIVNVNVNVGVSKYAVWEINGIYRAGVSSWFITSTFSGDLTGVDFSIFNETGYGRMQYTNTNTTGTTIIRFRASTNAPIGSSPSNTAGIVYSTSGPYLANRLVYANSPSTVASSDIEFDPSALTIGGNSRLLARNANNFVSYSNGGAITSMGDASVAKRLMVGQKVGVNNTSPTFSLDVSGDVNFTGALRYRGNIYSGSSLFDTYGDNIFTTKGNFGLGTTDPQYSLDVSGGARFTNGVTTGALNASNIAVTAMTATNIVGTSISAGTLIGTTMTGANLYLSSDLYVAGTLTTVNITTTNLYDTNITTGTLNVVNSMYAPSISAGTLTATTISSTNIAASVITTGTLRSLSLIGTDSTISNILNTNITTTSLRAFDISTGSLICSVINGASITTGILHADTLITSANIAVSVITAGTLNATTINSSTLVSSANIAVSVITAGTLNATTINSSTLVSSANIAVSVITAGTLQAVGLTAGNINFTGDLYKNGALYISSQWFSGTGGSLSYTNGNVGIATTAPGYTLDVSGDINFTGTLRQNGSTFGASNTFGNIIIGVSSIASASFSAANNASATDVTGLVFNSVNIRSFNMQMTVSVVRSAGGNLFDVFTIDGIQSAGGWVLYASSVGDDTGITFSITSGGQVQYTSPNFANWSSTTFRYTVNQVSNTGTYTSELSGLITNGSYLFDTVQINNTSSSVVGSNNGAFYVLGGAAFEKNLVLKDTTDSTSLSSGGALTVLGGAAVSKQLLVGTLVSSANIAASSVTTGTLNVTGAITAGGHVVPSANVTYDLGSANLRWRDLYLSGNTIDLGGLQITNSSSGSIRVTDTTGNLQRIEASEIRLVGADNQPIIITASGGNLNATNVLNPNTSLISSSNIVASNVSAGTINASTISSSIVNSTTITSANIYISNDLFVGGTLTTVNITSTNLLQTNVSATNIGASIITAGTLLASTSIIASGNSNTLGSIITTGGNVGVGITPSYKLHVSGDIFATGDITAFSDMRLKSDIRPITDSLYKVTQLQGVYYTHIETQKHSVGLIAQETLKVLPEVVATKGEYLGINYGNIVGLLIEAIKELNDKVTFLEKK
jgi:hypothetical protein